MNNPIRSLLSRWFWPDSRAHRDAVRIVCHEWFASVAGSDKVAAELIGVADADVAYTFALDRDVVRALGIDRPVVTWRWGEWAARSGRFKVLLPLMPIVWWALDLDRAGLVVTSSHSCVNAIRTPSALRVSYCHTPMRYAWEWRLEQERAPRWARPIVPVGAAVFRRLDARWARGVDRYIANSSFVAQRIERSYGRTATVVHPPIDVDRFAGRSVGSAPSDDAPFVSAGRFVPYKRFDLAIAACERAGVRCIIAGSGPDLARLRSLAGPGIEFVEDPDDETVVSLLAQARAFLFCGIEDFGMFPVEAQACGTPVIARRVGGALDSVVDGVTGRFVETDDVDDWATALHDFDRSAFDATTIRAHADEFGVDRFRAAVADLLSDVS